MCCNCCGETQRKIWVFGSGGLCLALGITMIVLWPDLSERLVLDSLTLKEGSKTYDNWVEAPIPIYLEFTMFNWTNPQDIHNASIKPHFVEMGPYVFLEKHLKQNITFYPNETVSYYEKRTWHFIPEQSNGTLNDMLTQAHAITATVADQTRHQKKWIKKITNFMLNREGGMLYTTKPVIEWIFTGYNDRLLDFLRLFNTSKIVIPYKRFGWLAERNGSATYDGLFTIHTGVDDNSKIGQLTHWNGQPESGFYKLPCGMINGTTGDLFPPHMNVKNEITIFATDACRYLNLAPNGTIDRYGIKATRWVGTIETLDSGENYPIQQCFCNPKDEECPKTGVVECKKCRDNAPIYASFPHFLMADSSYVNSISGVSPDPEKHLFSLAVEPTLGIPIEVNARLQINMMMEPDDDYDIYRGVQKVLMPMFWFEQKAILSKELASQAKLALNLSDIAVYTAIGLIVIGSMFLVTAIALTITKNWVRRIDDDQTMLTQ